MFELLSFLFGGLFRIAPEMMRLWDKGRERQHEKDMLDLQLKADEARAKLEMQKAELAGNIAMNQAELSAIIEATRAQSVRYEKTGNGFLDFLLVVAEVASGLVRPVLTYWYCVAAYGGYKVALYTLAINHGITWSTALTQIWTTNDHAVMVSIIGFWFVDRAIRRQAQ